MLVCGYSVANYYIRLFFFFIADRTDRILSTVLRSFFLQRKTTTKDCNYTMVSDCLHKFNSMNKTVTIQDRQMNLVLNESKKLIDSGFWIVPTVGKVSKAKNNKSERLTYSEFEKIVKTYNCNGLGILTNESTNYISFDLDTKDSTTPTLFKKRLLFELKLYPELSSKIMLSESPSGGFHLYVTFKDKTERSEFIGAFAWSKPDEQGKQKQTVTGRSVGQYCCEYPTPGYKWILNNKLQPLTDSDKNNLKQIFENLNDDKDRQARLERQDKERLQQRLDRLKLLSIPYHSGQAESDSTVKKTVWDDYNDRTSLDSILRQNGLEYLYRQGKFELYRRTGSTSKKSGYIDIDSNRFINFSDNVNLPTNKPLTAFDCYVHFNHSGNYQEASRDLFRQGFGQIESNKNQTFKSRQEQVQTVLNQSVRYELKPNEHINDVLSKVKFENGLHLVTGGTGSGKTYFVANNPEKVLIVSRNITTLENYEKYGFKRQVFNKASQDDSGLLTPEFNKLTVTYKSFRNYLNTVNLDGFTIVFDEAHLLNEAFSAVRSETMYCYYAIPELVKTNPVLLLSANEIYLNIENLKFKSRYYFNKPTVKRSVSISYNSDIDDLIHKIKQCLNKGQKVLIYTNRTESKYISEAIRKYLSLNYSIQFFDSSKHGQVELENLTSDITVTTSALVTGKDVMNQNLSVIFYAMDRDVSRSTFIQFFGRARHYKTASFYLLFAFSPNSEKYGKYSIHSLFRNACTIADATIQASINDLSFLRENKDRFVRKISDGLVRDYFTIDTYIQKIVSINTVMNESKLVEFMNSHNYSAKVEILTKAQKQQVTTESVKPLKLYDLELNEIDNNNERNIEFLTNVYERFSSLFQVGFDRQTSLDFCNTYKSKNKYRQFLERLIVECSLPDDNHFRQLYFRILTVTSEFITSDELVVKLKSVEIGSGKFTELGRIIAKIQRTESVDIKTLRQVLSSLRSYYEIESKRIMINKQRQVLYKFDSSDFLNYCDDSELLTPESLSSLFEHINVLK